MLLRRFLTGRVIVYGVSKLLFLFEFIWLMSIDVRIIFRIFSVFISDLEFRIYGHFCYYLSQKIKGQNIKVTNEIIVFSIMEM